MQSYAVSSCWVIDISNMVKFMAGLGRGQVCKIFARPPVAVIWNSWTYCEIHSCMQERRCSGPAHASICHG